MIDGHRGAEDRQMRTVEVDPTQVCGPADDGRGSERAQTGNHTYREGEAQNH